MCSIIKINFGVADPLLITEEVSKVTMSEQCNEHVPTQSQLTVKAELSIDIVPLSTFRQPADQFPR